MRKVTGKKTGRIEQSTRPGEVDEKTNLWGITRTFEACIRAQHERNEHIHDEDGLQNHCVLVVNAIRHLCHKIYGFER